MLTVLREFADKKKIIAGHCAAGLIFEIAGITEGKHLAIHPLAKPAIQKGIPTDEAATIDSNFYTAQCEHTLPSLMSKLIEAFQ